MDSDDNTRRQPEPNRFYEAEFTSSASSASDVLMVVIPDLSSDQPFGDPDGVVWSPMGGVLPQEGDRALVAESTDGSWWVLSWWSSTQDATATPGDVSALDARLDVLEATPESLQAPTLTNSWVDFDVNRPARYYRHNGRVYLSGLIKSGIVGSGAFTLPSGYRPVSVGNHVYACASNDVFGLVTVTTGGVVTPAAGSNVYFSLDGIHFRHA